MKLRTREDRRRRGPLGVLLGVLRTILLALLLAFLVGFVIATLLQREIEPGKRYYGVVPDAPEPVAQARPAHLA